MVRHDQCVWPGGLELRVNSTISSILACGIVDLRPRPERTLPSFASPSSANRDRQARTVAGFTPTRDAIRVFATPSAASSNASARCTCRCGAVCDRARTCSAARCPSDMTKAAAGVITHEVYPTST